MFLTTLRILSLIVLALAVIAAVLDITRSIADSTIVMTPLGVTWFELSPGTLNLAQATIQRHVHPWLWDPVVQTILLAPSWVVLGIVWLVLALASRKRKPRLQDRYSE